jgi:predicted ATPase with chaperone activity
MYPMVTHMSLAELMGEPHTIEDLLIPQNLVIDILLRLLYNEGNVNFRRMSQVTRVPAVLDEVLEWLRKEHLVEVSQASAGAGRLNYVFKLTAAGEERAQAALERSQYVGPFPVPVHYYNRAIELQTQSSRKISPQQIQESLKGLVLPADFHRRIGPAVNSGASLFLYGPSGNGKTTIAQKIAGLITGTDPIWLPYALTAGGQIIQIHDRLFHTPVRPEGSKTSIEGIDGRWNLFHRPSVVVGGELKMEALDLRLDPMAKIYEAPLQLKANGGIFLIDDFGRQQVSPADLLNRWIVPLENGVDYLRLRTGQTIVVPFRTLIVFSTNLDPYKLADDAFYRRIQMKVGIFSPDRERFQAIFRRVCTQTAIPFDQSSFEYLVTTWYQKPGRTFQSVHPRDLLRIVQALCEYSGCAPSLTPDLIDEACTTYFVEERYSAG